LEVFGGELKIHLQITHLIRGYRQTMRISKYRVHIALAILFGFLVRTWKLWEKPFWRDEAWVAHVIGTSWAQVLYSPEPTPVGFSILAKLSSSIGFVPAEVSLRLPSLIAGMAILALLPLLVRMIKGSRETAVLTIWLAAGSQPLIYFSRELKHYNFDTLMWLLGAYLTGLLVLGSRARKYKFAVPTGLAIVLCSVPWVSFGSVFPLTSVLLVSLIYCWRREVKDKLRILIGCSALYGISFLVALKTIILKKAAATASKPFWQNTEFKYQYEGLPDLEQVGQAAWTIIILPHVYLFPYLTYISAPLLVMGAWYWTNSQRAVLWSFITLTALLTTIATISNNYVLLGRTLLFLAPVYLIFMAQGAVSLGEGAGKHTLAKTFSSLITAGLILLSFTWGTLSIFSREGLYTNPNQANFYFDEMNCVEPAIEFLDREAGPEDKVFVLPYAGTQFIYYSKGRLPQAAHYDHGINFNIQVEFGVWLQSVGRKGWLVFLESERRPWIHMEIEKQGLAERPVMTLRGSNVWMIEPGTDDPREEK